MVLCVLPGSQRCPDERSNRQDIVVNAAMWVDTRPAARSDKIEDAVNYRTVTKALIDHVVVTWAIRQAWEDVAI